MGRGATIHASHGRDNATHSEASNATERVGGQRRLLEF